MDAQRRLLLTATQALRSGSRGCEASRSELSRCRPSILRALAPETKEEKPTNGGVPEGNVPPTTWRNASKELASSLGIGEDEASSLLRYVQQQSDLSTDLRQHPVTSLFPDAAGIYHAERLALLQTLRTVLGAQVLREDVGEEDTELDREYAKRFNAALLTERVHGSGLVARLVARAKSAPWAVPPGCGLEHARTRMGGMLISRNVLLQRELTLLCECIYLACATQSGMLPLEEVRSIADLATELCSRCERLADRDEAGVHLQHAYVVTLALVRAFGLVEGKGEEDEGQEQDQAWKAWKSEVEERHAQMAADSGLASRMACKGGEEGNTKNLSDGILAIATMAWSLVLPPSEDSIAMPALEASVSAGALAAVEVVYQSTTFRDDLPAFQFEYASAVHDVLCALLSSQRGAQLVAKLKDAGDDLATSIGQGYPALGLIDPTPRTSMGGLLSAMAAVYSRDPSLASLCVPVRDWSFLDYAAEGEPTLGLLAPYLLCVGAIATGESSAATEVFTRLLVPPPGAPTGIRWEVLFSSLEAYCHRYASVLGSGRHEKSLAGVMPPEDAAGLAAYLVAIRSCFETAPDSVPGWLRRLLDRQQSNPLEVLLQLTQFPAPVIVKMEVYALISAMATSTALCAQIWDALDAFGNLGMGAGRADLAMKLAEEEAKQENYGETLSYVKLINKLLSVAPLPDYGRTRAQYFSFVRNVVFAQCLRRGYRNLSQRWEIAAVCLENFERLLTKVTSAKVMQELDTPASMIMVDLLEEGSIFRAILGILCIGSEQLAQARLSSQEGTCMECAVDAALRVLLLALACDGAYAVAIRNARGGSAPPTIDRALLRDPSYAGAIMSYVSYTHSPELQIRAIRIVAELAARDDERLLSCLLSDTNGTQHIVSGFASALEAGFDSGSGMIDTLTALSLSGGTDTNLIENEHMADARASLLLDLIVESLVSAPVPSFGHYLLGFDVAAAPPGASALGLYDPRSYDSCLRPILALAESEVGLLESPFLHARCLELLYRLCEDTATRGSMHDLLRDRVSYFAPHIPVIFQSPLSDEGFESGLQQRTWLLRLAALALHDADESDPVDRGLLVRILGALFFPAADNHSATGGFSPGAEIMHADSEQKRSAAGEVLELCCTCIPVAPAGLNLAASSRRAAEELGIESALIDPALRTTTVAEQIDIPLFGATLQTRAEALIAQGGSRELFKEAVIAAVRYAAEWNEYAFTWTTVRGLAKAWQLAVEIAVSCRIHLLRDGAELMQNDIEDYLDVIIPLLSSTLALLPGAMNTKDGAALARPLALTVQTLVAQLVQNPNASGSPSPAASHALLRQLLAAVKVSTERRGEATSTPLYGALLAFLQYNRARVDSELLLDGTISLLRDASSWLLVATARDATEGNLGGNGAALRSIARCILATLSALDPMLTDGIFHTGAPQAFLADLPRSSASLFTAPLPIAWRASFALEAGLNMLIQLATTRTPHGAKQLAASGAVGALADFRAISIEVELTPGAPSGQLDSWRRVLACTLRLVLAIVSALPTSREVTEQASNFLSAQQRVLLRCLTGRSMSSSSLSLEHELELAELASALLACVQGKDPSSVPPPLRALMYNLAWQFFPRDGQASVRLANLAAQDAGFAEVVDKTWGIRCNIAQFLRCIASAELDCFPCVRPVAHADILGMDGRGSTPTLRLVIELLKTTVNEMFTHAERRDALLASMAPGQESMALQLSPEAIEGLKMEGVSLQMATGRDVALAARRQDKLLSRLFYLSENLLATLYLTLRRYLQSTSKDMFAVKEAFAASDSMYSTPVRSSSIGDPTSALGTPLELEQLGKLLLPVLETLSRMRGKDFGRDLQYLQLLVRRTKEYLAL